MDTGAFQTPPAVARYMAAMIPSKVRWVMEPTPGVGTLEIAAADAGFNVLGPTDFFLLNDTNRYECIIMNPPFSGKHMILDNAPPGFKETGMGVGYWILKRAMAMSDNIIALMPWFLLLDSDTRTREIKKFGLISITALPRKTFDYARIQTCVIQLQKGYKGETKYHIFDSHKL